jgi:hypothetical protein
VIVVQVGYMESRMERLVQDGMETARHLQVVFVDFHMENAQGSCRWAQRKVLEEQMSWSAARQRFGELCSRAAFNLVVEAAVRFVLADADDMEWEAQKQWTSAAEAKKLTTEAARLKSNVQYLQRHVPLLRGAPTVENLQLAMQRLVKEHLEMKAEWGEAGAALQVHDVEFFTTAVAFMARDLPDPVQ